MLAGSALTLGGGNTNIFPTGRIYLEEGTLFGDVKNQGTVQAFGTSSFSSYENELNRGSLVVEGNPELGNATLQIAGDLTNRNSVQLRNQGDPSSNASLIVGRDIVNERYFYSSSGGDRSIDASIDNQGYFYFDADTEIDGDFLDSSYMRLGPDALLNLSGTYSQSEDGQLDFSVGGTTAGVSHGQLNVSDTATLAGKLRVQQSGNEPPGNGEELSLITFAQREGRFRSRRAQFRRWSDLSI